MIHNEIAFAAAPEYFNEGVFDAHDLPDGKRGRTGAAYVGLLNSWWLGLVFGPPVAGFALIVPGRRAYLKHSAIGLGLVAAVALLIGVTALLVTPLVVSESALHGYWFPPGVTDRIAYAGAGAMRDFAFLGGWVGVFAAWCHLVGVRNRVRATSRRRPLAASDNSGRR